MTKDLPRNNRIKGERKEIDITYKRDVEGHTFENYNTYKTDNPDAIEIQMDTVEGIKDADQKVLLTLEIVEIKFLLAFIRPVRQGY